MVTVGIEFAAALKRLGGDEELLRELAAYFEEDAPKLLAAIRTGLAAGDAEIARRAAHSLRSLAANFDGEKAMSISRSIEEMAGKGELQPLPTALDQLDVELRALCVALRRFLARPLSPITPNGVL